MTINLGKRRNTNDSPIVATGVVLNSNTSTDIVTLTDRHSMLIMTNSGNQDAWIKLQSASVDNDVKGFVVFKGTTTELVLENVAYPGDVSGITGMGSTTINVTVI